MYTAYIQTKQSSQHPEAFLCVAVIWHSCGSPAAYNHERYFPSMAD